MRETLASDAVITLSAGLHAQLLHTIAQRFPDKSFGYLLSESSPQNPTDYILFEGNIRNHTLWKPEFESYGRYFVDHSDAGFVATPEESWRIQQEISARGLIEVGVFHSHQRHPANFSQIDYEMHLSRFESLWHMIISLRNPQLPQVRAYAVAVDGVHEIRVEVGT
jgi:proteasome lid subunit RPN8/RPN11